MTSCPRDGSQLVEQQSTLHGVAKCTTCAGLWVPSSAVVELIGETKKQKAQSAQGTSIRCPDDNGRLVTIEERGVEIDICGSCGGVWLDGGELEKLKIEKSIGSRIVDGLAEGAAEVGMQAAFEPATYKAIGQAAEGGIELVLQGVGALLDGL